jgi:hypothetical protein
MMLGVIIPHLDQAEKDLSDKWDNQLNETTNQISVPPSDDISRNVISKNSTKSSNNDCIANDAVNPNSLNPALAGKEHDEESENDGDEDVDNKDDSDDDDQLGGCKDSSSEGSEYNDKNLEGKGNKKTNTTKPPVGDGIKKKREKRFAYVYLIWSESMDFVKFGRSNALASRFRKRYQTVSMLHFNKNNN